MKLNRKFVFTNTQILSTIYIALICFVSFSQIILSSNVSSVLFIPKSNLYSFAVQLCMFGLIMVALLNRRYNKNKLLIMMSLIFIVLAVTTSSQNRGLVLLYLAILSYPRNLESKIFAKWQSYSFFITICYIVILYFLGAVSSDIVTRGDAIRNSCGFSSANAFANTAMIWLIMYIYYKQEQWKWKNSIFCGILFICIYSVTNSRMSCVISILLIVIVQIWAIKGQRERNAVFAVASFGYPVGMIICLTITHIFEKGYLQGPLSALNIFMSYRLGFMRNYYRDYGVKFFGQIIKTVSRSQQLVTREAWSGLDNSYMYTLISWGSVISIVFCVLYFLLGKYLKRNKNIYGALCVCAMCVIGLTENFFVNIAYNICIIIAAEMLSNSSKKIKITTIIEVKA